MEGQDAYYMEEPLTGFTSLAEIMNKPANERGFSIRTLAQELMEVILQLVELKRYHNDISTSSVFVSCKDKKLTVYLSEFYKYPEYNKELKEYTPAFMIFEDKKTDNYNMVDQLSKVLAVMLESEKRQGGWISKETYKDMMEYNDFQNKIKDKTDIEALRLCEYISNIKDLREVYDFKEEYSIVEEKGCPKGILGRGGFSTIYLVERNKEKWIPESGPRQRYALKGEVCETRPKHQINSKSDGLQQ